MSVEEWKKEAAEMALKARKWSESQWQEEKIGGHGIPVFMDCAHPKCKMVKTIFAVSPVTLRYAEKTAATEVWYCHRHDDKAWSERQHIKQELLPYLMKLKDLGTVNKGRLGLAKRDLDFLKSTGLISIDAIPKGATNKVYDIELSEQGKQYLSEHTAELAQYLNNQPKYQELEWYAGAYFLGYWTGGWRD